MIPLPAPVASLRPVLPVSRRRVLPLLLLALCPLAGGCRAPRAAPSAAPPLAVASWEGTRAAPVDAPAPSAAPALEPSFTLAETIALAAARNPRLAGARSRWLAARERSTIARSLPDPMVTYTEMLEPVQTRVGPTERMVSLTQAIPFPAKLSLAGRIADQQACVSEIEYHVALRDVVADVKVSYAEVLYLRKALRIVEQNQAIAKQLAEKSAALYAQADEERADAVSLFDTLKAQSQVAQLAYDSVTLGELLRTEEGRLNALLSRDPTAPVGVPADLRFRPVQASREALHALALDRRQELQAATRRITAADDALRLARLSRVPDFTVGLQYTGIGRPQTAVAGGGRDAFGLTVGMTIPLWASKNRARIAEAEAARCAARHDRRAAVDDAMERITKTYFRMENASRLVRLYGESLIPQAQRGMEIAEQWRDTGRDTMARLLEAQGVWLDFQLAYQRALADHEIAVARLEQLVGASLGHLRREEG